MDIFGTVAAAIGLAAKVKLTFEQASYNKSDGIALCSDIQSSLSRIDGYLKQSSTTHSEGLRQDLSEFERELKRILGHQDLLTKQSTDKLWDRSTSKLKDLYNAGDIKHSLAQLRQEIQACEQNLQRSCAIRTDCGVSTVLQNQETMQRQLQMLVDALLPTSNPVRMSTLEQIEDNIQDRISEIDTDGALGQELDRIRTRNSSQAVLSIKTAKFSLKSVSSSIVERDYLKRRVKELATILPRLSDQAVRQSNLLWFRDPFKGLVQWESSNAQKQSKEDSIRETLRILEILRSKQKILYLDAARDLLGLGRALGHLGMKTEATVMYDWGVQICKEFAGEVNPRMLFNLAQFLHKLFLDLRSRGQADAAEEVLTQAMEVRAQLGRLDQTTSFAELLSSVLNLGVSVHSAGRYEDAVELNQEAVTMGRELVERNRDTYLLHLALSLHGLGVSMHSVGRYEDAVKLKQEAVAMGRELVERNRDTYLPHLALSLYNLGVSVHSAGRYEDAVKLNQEAVTIRRELVERNRDTYLPHLASSLHNLGASVHLAGRYEDAVKLRQEAVTIRRELVERNRDTYLPDLALSLYNLGISMHSDSRYDDAVNLELETVTIRRELVERDRKTHLADLALSLRRLAVYLSSAKRDEEAAVFKEEADRLDEELAENGHS